MVQSQQWSRLSRHSITDLQGQPEIGCRPHAFRETWSNDTWGSLPVELDWGQNAHHADPAAPWMDMEQPKAHAATSTHALQGHKQPYHDTTDRGNFKQLQVHAHARGRMHPL